MIDYVRGTLAEKKSDLAIIEAHGVGYEINIPLSTYEQLPGEKADVRLYTHHYVREDAQKLYGFFSKSDRELFRQLIAINSIGPKTAMSILSKISADELMRCVSLGDAARLTKIPGIGAKTADRLVIELRGKLNITARAGAPKKGAAMGRPAGAAPSVRDEAFQALISLGYSDKQVAHAVERVVETLEGNVEIAVEEFIKKALQVL